MALKLAEQVSKSIQDVGQQTQSAIREGVQTIHDVGEQTQSAIREGSQVIQDVGQQTQSAIREGAKVIQDVGQQTQSAIRDGAQVIQDVGQQTQSSIREGAQVTQVELKRLHISQEISSLQIQLSSIQSEIRSLQRQKVDKKIKRQLIELRENESSLLNRLKNLKMGLLTPSTEQGFSKFDSSADTPYDPRSMQVSNPQKSKGWSYPFGKGCLTGFLMIVIGAIMCAIPAQALDQAIFDIPMETTTSNTEQTGPFYSVAIVIISLAMFIGFAYGFNPKAKIWQPIRNWVRTKIFRKPAIPREDTAQTGGTKPNQV